MKRGLPRQPTHDRAVDQVRLDLVGIHRLEMVHRDDALAQLLEPRILERQAELGLAEQEDLEQRIAARLEIGEHAQLLQALQRQRLRLVDHQQGPPPGARDGVEPLLDRREHARLGGVGRVDVEPRRDQPQQVLGAELGRDDLDDIHPLAVDLAEQVAPSAWSCPRPDRR